MKNFLIKMLMEETREQRESTRGESDLVNIIISKIFEQDSFTKHEKYFAYGPNLCKSPLEITLCEINE